MTKKIDGADWIGDRQRALFKALLALESPEECERFLLDLCTPAELTALADRWSVAQLLDRRVSYRQIRERTGVSTATVTRVARALTYGQNGYRALLDKVKPEFKADYNLDKDKSPRAKKEARRA